MKPRPSVLFVNLRRVKREGFESLLAARRLGFDVVMISSQPLPEFARPLVREALQVDTYEIDHALEAAQQLHARHSIQGVANWTEADLELVAQIARLLGLPGIKPEAARRARNKFLMKQALAHVDRLLPRFARVTDLADLVSAIESIGLPAVVKPTGASGSKGIFELHRAADLEVAIARLQAIARPDFDPIFRQYGAEFIVEEFLTGPEVSVEGFVAAGRVATVGITDKWTTDGYHLEAQHVHPSRLPPPARQEIERKTRLAIETLGLDQCAFHLEGKLTPDGFRFIETAARPGGDYIASHLIPMSTGIDYFGNVVRLATGSPLELEPTLPWHAGVRFILAAQPGRLRGLSNLEATLVEPGVDHLFLEVPPQAEIKLPPHHFGLQRLAAVIGRHPAYETLLATLDRAAARITPVIEGLPVPA